MKNPKRRTSRTVSVINIHNRHSRSTAGKHAMKSRASAMCHAIPHRSRNRDERAPGQSAQNRSDRRIHAGRNNHNLAGINRRHILFKPPQAGHANIRKNPVCNPEERERAACLMRHLGETVKAERILVPHFTLRDGLLADLLPGAHGAHHLDDDHLLAEARQLVTRYGANLAYCENTAELAVQIFDQTRDLHGLGERERVLLQFSALVHDVGSFINVRNRHKHTMYIVQAADIAGLTREEQDMVANVARYHRKSPPEPHHAEFMALERRHRVVVAYLAAILRLAYGLDVERSQRIKRVRCTVDGLRLLLKVDRRQIALERWSIAGKASLFREVFGLDVIVVPRGEDA